MIVLFFIITMTAFLFVGGNSAAEENHRLLKDIWDMGHLALFGLIIFSYFNQPSKTTYSFRYKFIFTTMFCLVVGTTVEIVQLFIQRDFSLSDILNDVIGGYLGLVALLVINKQHSLFIRVISIVAFVLLLIIGIRDFEKHIYDEFNMHKQFPVLADFETTLELERWAFMHTEGVRINKYPISGDYSLKVKFLPNEYSSLSLQNLKSDWRGYEKLVLSMFNPNYYNLDVELKITDEKHRANGGAYNDRFNKNMVLHYGWNIFEFAIEDILNSPKKRLMDVKNLKVISLFTHNVKKPETIYIDHIHLE